MRKIFEIWSYLNYIVDVQITGRKVLLAAETAKVVTCLGQLRLFLELMED